MERAALKPGRNQHLIRDLKRRLNFSVVDSQAGLGLTSDWRESNRNSADGVLVCVSNQKTTAEKWQDKQQ
jgi:hypothetical protein